MLTILLREIFTSVMHKTLRWVCVQLAGNTAISNRMLDAQAIGILPVLFQIVSASMCALTQLHALMTKIAERDTTAIIYLTAQERRMGVSGAKDEEGIYSATKFARIIRTAHQICLTASTLNISMEKLRGLSLGA
jgi:hypothetical protein